MSLWWLQYLCVLAPIALAVYSRSPAAYEALQSFSILQLPSATTLKSYTKSNKEAPGDCARRLAEERALYDAQAQQHLKEKKPNPPLHEGALIADEVKVAAKLHWNSRDDSIIGHSMTAEDMATLQDLYRSLEKDPKAVKADYVLQTLWRDHSTSHDIVGPYSTSSGPFSAKSMLACIMDSLRQFHTFGFKVSLLVVDGASTNLTMLKLLLGHQGAFGHNNSQQDRHMIPVSFNNPFSGEDLFVTICPTHQVSVPTLVTTDHYSPVNL